jgi:uncharacterized membrane protein (UPF0127 family)
MSTKIKFILIAAATFLIIFFAFSNFYYNHISQSPVYQKAMIKTGDAEIKADIADTPAKQTLGLSGRKNLMQNEGMIFDFDRPDLWGIWMKDMNFPIDIVWIDSNFKIVGIKENATPDSYPQIFYPKEKSSYVLEVNAGFAKNNNFKIGDSIHISDNQ